MKGAFTVVVTKIKYPLISWEDFTLKLSTFFLSFFQQLKENIEQFFTKFVEEGKATVRLKEPAVDVCLSKVESW